MYSFLRFSVCSCVGEETSFTILRISFRYVIMRVSRWFLTDVPGDVIRIISNSRTTKYDFENIILISRFQKLLDNKSMCFVFFIALFALFMAIFAFFIFSLIFQLHSKHTIDDNFKHECSWFLAKRFGLRHCRHRRSHYRNIWIHVLRKFQHDPRISDQLASIIFIVSPRFKKKSLTKIWRNSFLLLSNESTLLFYLNEIFEKWLFI